MKQLVFFAIVSAMYFMVSCYANDPEAYNEELEANCNFWTAIAATTPVNDPDYNLSLAIAVVECTEDKLPIAFCIKNICF